MFNNPIADFLEGVGASEIPDAMCWQCLTSPWGDRFEAMQFDPEKECMEELSKYYREMIRSKDFSVIESQSVETRKVAAVCLSVVKNGKNYDGKTTYILCPHNP
jgi:hypothetical protein